MTRVRWLRASWPMAMRSLATRLKQYSFSNDVPDGFVLERVRDEFIEGKHFERVVVDEVIRDPFGRETEFRRVIYREVDFVFSAESPQIELRQFPRNMRSFFSRIAEAGEFKVTLAPLRVDVLGWAERVADRFPQGFRIDSAQLSDVSLDGSTKARVTMFGPDDIREAYQLFTRQREHVLDRLQVNIRTDDRVIRCELSTDATLRSRDVIGSDLAEKIRRALPPLTEIET